MSSAIKTGIIASHCGISCDTRACSEKLRATGDARIWCTQGCTMLSKLVQARTYSCEIFRDYSYNFQGFRIQCHYSYIFLVLLTLNTITGINFPQRLSIIVGSCSCSEEVFASQERVSGFPEKGADLRGSPGNLWGSSGNFRGSLWNFRGTPGLLLSSTVKELPGKSPKNFWGSWGELPGKSAGTFQKLGGGPDSLPATRQICLQVTGINRFGALTCHAFEKKGNKRAVYKHKRMQQTRENADFSSPQKMHKHKELQQNLPRRPPPWEPLTPLNSLCTGPLCPSKYRKKPMHKEFRGGGVLGSPKLFMHLFFVYLSCCLISGSLRGNSKP